MVTILHDSDCAVHNMPASPNGPCDCGAAALLSTTGPTGGRQAADRGGGRNAEKARELAPPIDADFIDIVFDGPPGPEAGRFVEVENSSGKSISFGRWFQRPDGYWVLRFGWEWAP